MIVVTTSPKVKPTPKSICVFLFVNKGMDLLHLSSIFKNEKVIQLLPNCLKSEEDDLPVVTTSLVPPIRNTIFNYKDVVSNTTMTSSNGVFSIKDLPKCECHLSAFCDNHHKHIVTKDLRVIDNSKLRSLLSKGPNYREPRFSNFEKCFDSVVVRVG